MMMSERSVWMLTGDFYPGTGGGERQAQNLSRELIKNGWLVNVLTRRHGFKHLRGVAEDEIVDTIPVHRLYARGGGRVAALLYVAGGLWFLMRCRRRRIYHAHGEGAQAWLAIIARYLLGGRAIIKLRSGAQAYATAHLGGVRRRLFVAQLRLADQVIVVNREVEGYVLTLGILQKSVELLPNGVDTQAFGPVSPSEKTALRQKLHLPADTRIALYVGRLDKVKGVDLLVSAWATLPEDLRRRGLLVIVGPGSEQRALEEQAAVGGVGDSVLFTGLQSNVIDYYRAADIFVLPSRSEGLSNALAEAMACALPAVASALGGALDLIREGESGHLFEPENVAQLSEKLAQLLNSDAKRLQMGQRGREAVIAYNDFSGTLEKLETMYCSLGEG